MIIQWEFDMEGKIVNTNSGSYVRVMPGSDLLASERDLLDLLSYCYEAGDSKILLEGIYLDPAFFDLSSGVAGEIFHKLSTYQVKTAIVADLQAIKSERFQELIRESNKGRQINYFESVTDAEKWLVTY